MAFASRVSSAMRASPAPATATATGTAMQRSPAEPNAPAVICDAAKAMSASGMTTAWLLAPPSACTRLPAAMPWACTYLAIGVDPTKETAATPGWARSASTASLPPWTTWNTPSGRPAFLYSPATKLAADGSRSLGLRMNALPVAMAIGCIHIGTIAGKLKGVMPATTPTGCRMLCTSTPLEAFDE